MEILEILRIVRHEYNYQISEGYNTGFCSAVVDAAHKEELTYNDRLKFENYLKRSKRNQVWFYTAMNVKTKSKDQFMWLMLDTKARFKWIDKHILKYE